MDFATSLTQSGTNFVSVPVLAFILGLISVALKADLRLPDAVYQATSMYLLFAIGLKGGVALRASEPAEVLAPIGVALLLGVTIPLIAFTSKYFPNYAVTAWQSQVLVSRFDRYS